ncbi:MAG TPA: M43 family zinc metalloprotease [Ferruginibacter sp.]|nr:M43 family zinc metalloprotease [Ferruginibacter sp.]
MKKIYFSLIGLLFCSITFAQQGKNLVGTENIPPKRCATAELLQSFIQNTPGAQTTESFESWISQKIAERRAIGLNRTVTPNVLLPVVFHIIHDNETVGTGRNISQALIRQQVLQINKDFANLSNSPYAVSENTGIQFALAQTDPLGNTLAEPGIDRINRNDKTWTAPPYTVGYASPANNYLTNTIKPNSIWDPTRYLNIWISEWEAGILGIATFPTASGLSGLGGGETNSTAGVTVDFQTVGSLFTTNTSCANIYGKGRTLTHELGHFFGLRHIWGDGTCATDYCADTPTHEDANDGVPVHPKPNACGTLDEMFENYMDYCNDIASNTFTTNQVDRMEAVMTNSPRRNTLHASTVGKVLVTASNQIAFADCAGTLTVSEASSMTVCPKYKDISLMLNVEDKATATTTVTINTAGTAVNGVHYQLLTPTVTFNNGDNFKAINIRIFDDAVASGVRTINLSYSIGAGGGVSAAPTAQTYAITILDNDLNSGINNNNQTVTIFSENFGTTGVNGTLPSGWIRGTFSASTNTWVANNQYGLATGFSAADGRALHITNVASSEVAPNEYTLTGASNAVAITRGINTTGYKNIKVTFDYACEGELFGGDIYDYGALLYTVSTQTTNLNYVTDNNNEVIQFQGQPNKTNVTINLPADVENRTNFWLAFNWVNDGSEGSNPPFIIDNIVVTGEVLGVESVLNQSVTNSQNSGQTSQYVSNTNKIIAQIANPNANIGCITASITAAGTNLIPLTTNAGSYQRSEKVIRLTPAVANTTATYQATFYFTTAELAAWGANVPNLKILKVADGVSLSSTLNNTNSAIFTPTVSDQRATAGYASFTINATGGFSQFVLVSQNVALPVSLLSFEARPNGKNILLNWSTATETNNKGFVVERSANGTQFESIGWVDGAINSSRETAYSYADNFVQPNQLYYYRLRQTDIDARESLSEIKSAKIKGSADVHITLSPNPAKGQLKIFSTGGKALSDIHLYDTKGQLVQTWRNINCSTEAFLLDISNVAAGVYMIQVVNGKAKATEKLIIHP